MSEIVKTLFGAVTGGDGHVRYVSNAPAADRARLNDQSERILAWLRQGPKLNIELAGLALKYTSRISDLRRAGHVITCERLGKGLTRYTLQGSVK